LIASMEIWLCVSVDEQISTISISLSSMIFL